MREPRLVELPAAEVKPIDVSGDESPDAPFNAELFVLICLLILAILTLMYFAADVVLPLVLALVFSLLFQPGMRLLERFHIPRIIAALLLILAVFGAIIGIGAALSGPAASWAQKLPGGIARLQERFAFLSQPITATQTFFRQFDGGQPAGAPSAGAAVEAMLLKGTSHFASGFAETMLILILLLGSGDSFLRRLVEIVRDFRQKRRVVSLSHQIEDNISAYLLTITMMNTLVGIATAIAMWLSGLADPLLWGGCAFLLNFVPIIGPAIGVGLFLFAGLLAIDNIWQALIPAAAYLTIHLVEGEALTPLLLARRFTLNPVIVVLSVIFWFWMWGAPGAILAVPMLAIAKIICDDVKSLNAIGHFLEA